MLMLLDMLILVPELGLIPGPKPGPPGPPNPGLPNPEPPKPGLPNWPGPKGGRPPELACAFAEPNDPNWGERATRIPVMARILLMFDEC